MNHNKNACPNYIMCLREHRAYNKLKAGQDVAGYEALGNMLSSHEGDIDYVSKEDIIEAFESFPEDLSKY
jgi:hypothetical protein